MGSKRDLDYALSLFRFGVILIITTFVTWLIIITKKIKSKTEVLNQEWAKLSFGDLMLTIEITDNMER